MKIEIKLGDVVLDPANRIDLKSLAEEKALDLIRSAFGFLAAGTEFAIQSGILSITIQEHGAEEQDKVQKLVHSALELAQAGKHTQAIALFLQALEIIPSHTETRRNLAMAYLKSGNTEAAKNQLIDVLRLSPKDAQAFTLLGNIYARDTNPPDLAAAERCYDNAVILVPGDATNWSNLATVKLQREEFATAAPLYRKAIEFDPQLAYARFGLAQALATPGDTQGGLQVLEDLFDAKLLDTAQNQVIKGDCQELYLSLCSAIADSAAFDSMWRAVHVYRETVAGITGWQIEIKEDPAVENAMAATSYPEDAATPNRYVVRYSPHGKPVLPYMVARELELLLLRFEAARQGEQASWILERASPSVNRIITLHINQNAYSKSKKDALSQFVSRVVQTLMPQLPEFPLYALADMRLWTKLPAIRPSQFIGIYLFATRRRHPLDSAEVSKGLPLAFRNAFETAAAAWALYVDRITGGRSRWSQPYALSPGMPLARDIADAWHHSFESAAATAPVTSELLDALKASDWYSRHKG